MWLRIALAGNAFVTCPDAIAVYRRHAESMSRNHKRMWHSGISVLRNARRRHACPTCDEVFAKGVDTWRRYCYLSILRADIRNAVRSRRVGSALKALGNAVYDDPPVATLIAGSVIRNLRVAVR